MIHTCIYMAVILAPGASTPTLKNGEKIIPTVLYGCPEKYLTQEKADEAHKTK
jgi:hypothetical protein